MSSEFLTTLPFTINQLSFSENALKLTYSNVEFKIFRGYPGPRFKRREEEGKEMAREGTVRSGRRKGGETLLRGIATG
jgi:hypothetical protein